MLQPPASAIVNTEQPPQFARTRLSYTEQIAIGSLGRKEIGEENQGRDRSEGIQYLFFSLRNLEQESLNMSLLNVANDANKTYTIYNINSTNIQTQTNCY